MERDEFARQLAAAQIPTSVIDDALDFGPGRTNPLIEGRISDEQIDAFYGALRNERGGRKGGGGDTWGLVGVYVQSSSTMWNALNRLR